MTCRLPAPPADGTHIVVGTTGAVGPAVVRRLVGSGRPVLAVARDKHALAMLENDPVRACVADLGSDDAIADPMITTSVRLAKSLLDWVRQRAATEHVRPSVLIRQWIEQRRDTDGTENAGNLAARVERLERAVFRETRAS